MVTSWCEESVSVKIGVLGGTFDPPHYGHLAIAEVAIEQLGLSRVLFVPAGQPPHKPQKPVTLAQHRAAMVSLAIADNDAFLLSRADLERPGPHYTADLLSILRHECPGAELFFLIGSDSLTQFPAWHHPARIVAQAKLAVMRRPGWEADVEALKWGVPNIVEQLVWLDAPSIAISGTGIRQRVAAGDPIAGLVPPPVEHYIRKHGLYRPG
jgi:nicotinate-nucleotide adenylyltransferase